MRTGPSVSLNFRHIEGWAVWLEREPFGAIEGWTYTAHVHLDEAGVPFKHRRVGIEAVETGDRAKLLGNRVSCQLIVRPLALGCIGGARYLRNAFDETAARDRARLYLNREQGTP